MLLALAMAATCELATLQPLEAELVPVGFTKGGSFVYLERVENCECSAGICVISDYEGTKPCVQGGILKLVSHDPVSDRKQVLKASPDPARPVSCEDALKLARDAGVTTLGADFKKFPLSSDGDELRAEVEIIPDKPYEGDRVNYGDGETHRVLLRSSKRGLKKLGEFRNSDGSNTAILSEVAGYLRTPASDRIIVVTRRVYRVFEEETGVELRFWGARLDQGFKAAAPAR